MMAPHKKRMYKKMVPYPTLEPEEAFDRWKRQAQFDQDYIDG